MYLKVCFILLKGKCEMQMQITHNTSFRMNFSQNKFCMLYSALSAAYILTFVDFFYL